jgi:hypothetical protein
MDLESRRQMTLELYNDLICPVCLELPLAEILICKLGHHLCSLCFKSLPKSKCPTCRESMICSLRCFLLEKIVARLLHKCPNDNCNVEYLLNEKQAHELVCEFGKFNCPDKFCKWRGSFILFKDHIVNVKHSDFVKILDNVTAIENQIMIPFGKKQGEHWCDTVYIFLMSREDNIISLSFIHQQQDNSSNEEMSVTATSYGHMQRLPFSVRILTPSETDPQHQLMFEGQVYFRNNNFNYNKRFIMFPSKSYLKNMGFLDNENFLIIRILFQPLARELLENGESDFTSDSELEMLSEQSFS